MGTNSQLLCIMGVF